MRRLSLLGTHRKCLLPLASPSLLPRILLFRKKDLLPFSQYQSLWGPAAAGSVLSVPTTSSSSHLRQSMHMYSQEQGPPTRRVDLELSAQPVNNINIRSRVVLFSNLAPGVTHHQVLTFAVAFGKLRALVRRLGTKWALVEMENISDAEKMILSAEAMLPTIDGQEFKIRYSRETALGQLRPFEQSLCESNAQTNATTTTTTAAHKKEGPTLSAASSTTSPTTTRSSRVLHLKGIPVQASVEDLRSFAESFGPVHAICRKPFLRWALIEMVNEEDAAKMVHSPVPAQLAKFPEQTFLVQRSAQEFIKEPTTSFLSLSPHSDGAAAAALLSLSNSGRIVKVSLEPTAVFISQLFGELGATRVQVLPASGGKAPKIHLEFPAEENAHAALEQLHQIFPSSFLPGDRLTLSNKFSTYEFGEGGSLKLL